MNTYRIVIERTTVERTELEVQADTITEACSISNRYPADLAPSLKRRVRVASEFAEDNRRGVRHEVVSARAT